MRSENYIIQLQLEIQKLQLKNHELKLENAILDTALINACQSIARSLNFSQEAVTKLRDKFIKQVKDNYEYYDENKIVNSENIKDQIKNENINASNINLSKSQLEEIYNRR